MRPGREEDRCVWKRGSGERTGVTTAAQEERCVENCTANGASSSLVDTL